jgi:hypothetical protein
VYDGVLPPAAKAADAVPPPAKACLAVPKLGLVDHEVPSYTSVAPVFDGVNPPKARTSVLSGAFVEPARNLLPIFKLPPDVQFVPSYSSVVVVSRSGLGYRSPPK